MINNKIQLIHPTIIMNTASVVADVMRHIIKQGKDAIHDQFIKREKVPSFANKSSSSNYQEIVIHGGYQTENIKKNSYYNFKKDNMPENIAKDNMTIKSHQIIHHPKSLTKTSPFKSTQQKYYSSRKKNMQVSSSSAFNPNLEDTQKQKQNQFIKLSENNSNRKVVERAVLRAENQQQKMREKKRLQLLKQYQQKLENQVFQKQVTLLQFKRQDRQAEKQRILESHMKKGDSFKFNFDNDGQLMLFQSQNNIKSHYPPQTIFKIRSDNDQIQEDVEAQKQNIDEIHPLERNFHENQRIRSARGEAFASAVMKTVNLSRISMNGSMIEVDAEQFMKRNDLFNNNHSRQTSSIPYLQPKVGTVYTEIATNQVVGSSKEPRSSTTAIAKEDTEYESRDASKRGKVFDGFQHYDRKYSKTARVLGNRDDYSQDIIKTSSRPIKTAKQSARNGSITDRRPHTSVNRGRITTANEKLVQSLLQQ